MIMIQEEYHMKHNRRARAHIESLRLTSYDHATVAPVLSRDSRNEGASRLDGRILLGRDDDLWERKLALDDAIERIQRFCGLARWGIPGIVWNWMIPLCDERYEVMSNESDD